MSLNSAQKQRQYRAKHLGIDGQKVRLQAFVEISTSAQLRRLARHYGYSLTTMLESIVAQAHRSAVDALSPAEQERFYRD